MTPEERAEELLIVFSVCGQATKEVIADAIREAQREAVAESCGARDGPCHVCGKPTNRLAGNPTLWPLQFPAPGGESGKCVYWHNGCVMAKMAKLKEAEEWVARVDWRNCPDCSIMWPHPSETSGMKCPSCLVLAERVYWMQETIKKGQAEEA